MLVTASINLPLSWLAPGFSLNDAYNHPFQLRQFSAFPGLLLIFISEQCPVAQFVWPIINKLHDDFKRQVAFLAINTMAKERDKHEGLSAMNKTVERYAINFPYLVDEQQRVSKLYHVQCLPDFYLFKNEGGHNFALQYHGRLNDNYDHPELVGEESLKQALIRQKGNLTPLMYQHPAQGCPIFTS